MPPPLQKTIYVHYYYAPFWRMQHGVINIPALQGRCTDDAYLSQLLGLQGSFFCTAFFEAKAVRLLFPARSPASVELVRVRRTNIIYDAVASLRPSRGSVTIEIDLGLRPCFVALPAPLSNTLGIISGLRLATHTSSLAETILFLVLVFLLQVASYFLASNPRSI
ncbi:hypothetical protein ABW21_db0205851 [Orbilia brochopaga]|nr:hypothetical protein ABW21_db0205851 [Drechslerella brochopaga]